MIPQEKIEQAENVANDYKHWEESEAFKDGFYSGVRFAEAEMKQQAQEFAEWINNNRWYAILEDSGLRWRDGGSQAYTTSELYAKFEAEMNQQNNGG